MVGEAPGADEDEQGKCFVGRSGRLLDQMFAEAGLNTNRDLLITNVVKCRPPENRKPLNDEVKACHPFLETQIDLLRPKLVILLGATALKRFFPEKKTFSMSEEAGKIFSFERKGGTMHGMVLYHPAYLLYDPRKREDMRRHLATLKEFLKKEKLC